MAEKNSSRTKSLWAMLFIIAIVPLIGGCGFLASRPLEISLAPKVPQAGVNIGTGTTIYLSVLDQRSEKILGYRVNVAARQRLGWEVRGTISASEDIVALVQKSLKDGLTSLGFETLTAPEPSVPQLEVVVQHLRYGISDIGETLLKAHYDGLITGKVHKGATLQYEKSYHYACQYSPFSVPIARSWFEENFNAALSDLMGQLLADLELLKALRK